MTGDLFTAAGIADQLDAPDGRVKLCAACSAERPYRRGLCPRCLAAGYEAPTLTAGTGTIHTPGELVDQAEPEPAYRTLKSADALGHDVWHVLDDHDQWVQSFALRREAVAAIERLTTPND